MRSIVVKRYLTGIIILVLGILGSAMLVVGIGLFLFYQHIREQTLEGQMELHLPGSGKPLATDANTLEVEEKPTEITVIVRSSPDGNIDKLVVRKIEKEVSISSKNWSIHLCQELEKSRKNLKNKNSITLKSENALKWSEIVEVMNTCKKAGFENIGFAPLLDCEDGKEP